jgi:hypothetical protein
LPYEASIGVVEEVMKVLLAIIILTVTVHAQYLPKGLEVVCGGYRFKGRFIGLEDRKAWWMIYKGKLYAPNAAHRIPAQDAGRSDRAFMPDQARWLVYKLKCDYIKDKGLTQAQLERKYKPKCECKCTCCK